ncbi:SAM-dependent methyltransferase [Streptomyces sp. NRRL S-448]|uniref:SAM-dependent methyltransferase n=1 Tax=Streptomyces sp. NRRL S-448 TaxID=1463907 RepID=UPI003568030B
MRPPSGPYARHSHIDVSVPASTRVYDVLLGEQHYQPDRDLVDELLRVAPWTKQAARDNRAHGLRAAEDLARAGITQFADLGTGIPRGSRDGDVHHVVRAVQPDARVVSVDADAMAHARRRMQNEDLRDAAIQYDIADMAGLLAHPALQALDRQRAIAVLAHEVLSEIPNTDTAVRLMAELREWLPPGSAISLTHAAGDVRPADPVRATAIANLSRLYREAGISFHPRTRYEVAALAGPWPLADPGVDFVGRWHPRRLGCLAPVDAAYAFIACSPLCRRSAERLGDDAGLHGEQENR